ncbi:MAG: glycosyltransferase family 2 protein [bacterium]|nr:glycosyltransferase family 2 protein [bacterium]
MKICVTIPAFNEEKSIGSVIDNIKDVLKKSKYSFDIIVVDDGSRDNTAKTAQKHGAIVFRHPINCGLAKAFRTEMEKCLERKPDIIVHTDADGQYMATSIPKLIKAVEDGADLALGSRFQGKIEKMTLTKKLGNMAFSKVISQVTGRKISDAQTGFRAFTREVAEKVQITSNYTYTQEQIIRAIKCGFLIKEIPIYFAKREGKSRLMKNPFQYAGRAGVNVLRIYRDYEPLKFFGLVGLIFFVLGFLAGLWLVWLFISTGIVGHMPTVMLSVLLMSIGVQIILFGFFADMNRK